MESDYFIKGLDMHRNELQPHEVGFYSIFFEKKIIAFILQYLDLTSLGRVESVVTDFNKTTQDKQYGLWHNMLLRHFPNEAHLDKQSDIITIKKQLKSLDKDGHSTQGKTKYHTIARLIRGGDFSEELLKAKGFETKQSLFSAVSNSMGKDGHGHCLVREHILVNKNQELLDYIFNEQLKNYLLEDGTIDVHKKPKGSSFQILLLACVCNQPTAFIQTLIAKGADYNATVNLNRNYPLLSLVAMGGRNDIARLLLSYKDIDINWDGDRRNPTPLLVATERGELETINILLADNRLQIPNSLTIPFRHAVQEGMEEISKIFIEKSPVLVNDVTNQSYGTPLCLAVACNKVNMFNLLITHGAEVNLPGENGDTPLHVAVEERNIHLTRALISHGANVNLQGRDGITPLQTAVRFSNINMTHLLLFHGADYRQIKIDKTLNDPVTNLISTLQSAMLTPAVTESLKETAVRMLDNYISPQTPFNQILNLHGKYARFFAGEWNQLHCSQAKKLLKEIEGLPDDDSSDLLIQHCCEKTLAEISNNDTLHTIVMAIHIISNRKNLERKENLEQDVHQNKRRRLS